VIGTTPELGLHDGPRLPGSRLSPSEPRDRRDRPARCLLFAPPPICPAPSTPGHEAPRPTVATRSVLFRPRVFSTPRRLAPRQGCEHEARYRQGFAASEAPPAGEPADRAHATAQHPKDALASARHLPCEGGRWRPGPYRGHPDWRSACRSPRAPWRCARGARGSGSPRERSRRRWIHRTPGYPGGSPHRWLTRQCVARARRPRRVPACRRRSTTPASGAPKTSLRRDPPPASLPWCCDRSGGRTARRRNDLLEGAAEPPTRRSLVPGEIDPVTLKSRRISTSPLHGPRTRDGSHPTHAGARVGSASMSRHARSATSKCSSGRGRVRADRTTRRSLGRTRYLDRATLPARPMAGTRTVPC